MTGTTFDFSSFSDIQLAAVVNDPHAEEPTGNDDLDAMWSELLPAARAELKRRTTRVYRIIIDREGNVGDYINDYFFEGTKAEFAAAFKLTGKDNPHRATGTVALPNGYVLHWGVQD